MIYLLAWVLIGVLVESVFEVAWRYEGLKAHRLDLQGWLCGVLFLWPFTLYMLVYWGLLRLRRGR